MGSYAVAVDQVQRAPGIDRGAAGACFQISQRHPNRQSNLGPQCQAGSAREVEDEGSHKYGRKDWSARVNVIELTQGLVPRQIYPRLFTSFANRCCEQTRILRVSPAPWERDLSGPRVGFMLNPLYQEQHQILIPRGREDHADCSFGHARFIHTGGVVTFEARGE